MVVHLGFRGRKKKERKKAEGMDNSHSRESITDPIDHTKNRESNSLSNQWFFLIILPIKISKAKETWDVLISSRPRSLRLRYGILLSFHPTHTQTPKKGQIHHQPHYAKQKWLTRSWLDRWELTIDWDEGSSWSFELNLSLNPILAFVLTSLDFDEKRQERMRCRSSEDLR